LIYEKNKLEQDYHEKDHIIKLIESSVTSKSTIYEAQENEVGKIIVDKLNTEAFQDKMNNDH
jgi:hypothetical protein